MNQRFDVDCEPQDYAEGTYEKEVRESANSPGCGSSYGAGSEECRIQVVMPRSGVSLGVRDECVAVANIIKLVAAESPELNVRVDDPTDFDPPASELPRDRVLIRDQRQMRDASLIVIVANGPSSGMGIEIGSAVRGTIPRMLIARRGLVASPVLLARIEPTVATIDYESLEDLKPQLAKLFPNVVQKVMDSQQRRREILESISSAKLPQELFRIRVRRHRTLASIAKETGIPESELRELERDPKAWSDSSFIQMHQLARALHWTYAVSGDGVPTMIDDELGVPDTVTRSLDNLYEVLRDDGVWLPCEQVLRCWNGYQQENNYLPEEAITVAMRDEEYPVWDKATWIDRLREASEGTLFGSDI